MHSAIWSEGWNGLGGMDSFLMSVCSSTQDMRALLQKKKITMVKRNHLDMSTVARERMLFQN